MNPGPSACEADVIPLHHVPLLVGAQVYIAVTHAQGMRPRRVAHQNPPPQTVWRIGRRSLLRRWRQLRGTHFRAPAPNAANSVRLATAASTGPCCGNHSKAAHWACSRITSLFRRCFYTGPQKLGVHPWRSRTPRAAIIGALCFRKAARGKAALGNQDLRGPGPATMASVAAGLHRPHCLDISASLAPPAWPILAVRAGPTVRKAWRSRSRHNRAHPSFSVPPRLGLAP